MAGLEQHFAFDFVPQTCFRSFSCLFLRRFAVEVGSGCVLKAQKKDGCVCLPAEEPTAIGDSSLSIQKLLSPLSGSSSLCCFPFPLSQAALVVAIWQDLLVCLFFRANSKSLPSSLCLLPYATACVLEYGMFINEAYQRRQHTHTNLLDGLRRRRFMGSCLNRSLDVNALLYLLIYFSFKVLCVIFRRIHAI